MMTVQESRLPPLREGDALLVTDVQNCFLPGGSLGVRSGDEVVEPLNHAIRIFEQLALPVFITRDWHPTNHISFQEQGGPWPVHCVAGTEGSDFADDLIVPDRSIIISKGTNWDQEEYSTFNGRDPEGIRLNEHLDRLEIRRVFIGGLATDYCILNSVMDLCNAGYKVHVLSDAVRAVNVKADDGDNAVREMVKCGAVIIQTRDLKA